MTRRRQLAAALALLPLLPLLGFPTGAWANTPRVYGIVSLVADHLTVTGFETTTGSGLAQNQTEVIPLDTDELEKAVLRAGLRAVTESKLGKAVPLLINDGALYRGQADLVSGNRVSLPASLLQTLKSQGVTHLLLATKHRAEAQMKAHDTTLGTGRVEGLGFYVDRVTIMRTVGAGSRAPGYLAPHAYLRYSLIELSGNKLLASRTVTASTVIGVAGSEAGADPWQLLDSAGKIKAISDLIGKDSAPVLRELLAS
ncbi:MAG: hypothetical protein Q7U99_21885 [Rubrivivax sp.]|nr:hypothetical protein [Rubrivivax sp.]